MDDLDFTVPRGAIVGIIGANGMGKTTLFRMLVGQENPDAGDIRVGETVPLAYVDQSRADLDGEKLCGRKFQAAVTFDVITVGKYEVSSRAYVGRFNFRGQDQQNMSAIYPA